MIDMRTYRCLGRSGCLGCPLLHFGISFCSGVSYILAYTYNPDDIVLRISAGSSIKKYFNNMVTASEQWELEVGRFDPVESVFENVGDRFLKVDLYKLIYKLAAINVFRREARKRGHALRKPEVNSTRS